MKLLVLFLQYDTKKYPESFEKACIYIEKIRCSKIYIIIDNAHENKDTKKINYNTYIIGGDNSAWEFSGWDKGLEFANKNDIDYDIVLFVNDAFFAYGWSILENAATYKLANITKNHEAFMGQLDTKGYPMKIYGKNVSSWICSNAFFMHKKILNLLDKITSVVENDLNYFLYKSFNESYFLPNAPLDENYKNMARNWLTKEWHSKIIVSEKNWGFFRKKVQAMLNESLLTSRIRSLGFEIISYAQLKESHEKKTLLKIKRFLHKFC